MVNAITSEEKNEEHHENMEAIFDTTLTSTSESKEGIAQGEPISNADAEAALKSADPTPDSPTTVGDLATSVASGKPAGDLEDNMDEFKAFLKLADESNDDRVEPSEVLALFEEIDTNKNGKLEKEEAEAWILAGNDAQKRINAMNVLFHIPPPPPPSPEPAPAPVVQWQLIIIQMCGGKNCQSVNKDQFNKWANALDFDAKKGLLDLADGNRDGKLEAREIHEMFTVIDYDSSGAITVTELSRWYSAPAKAAIDAPAKTEIVDTNNDGIISAVEASAFAEKLDADKSGSVSMPELTQAIDQSETVAAKSEAYLETFDANKDGKVDDAEIKNVIKTADTNNDGKVDGKEFKIFISVATK